MSPKPAASDLTIGELSSSTALVNTYTYDSFGKLIVSTGTLTNPFQYAGREFDSETGLYYNRSRFYNSIIGRFVTEGSLGYERRSEFL